MFPFVQSKTCCNTCPAGSLNYRDVLLAFGRASADANSEADLGMDFSGRVGSQDVQLLVTFRGISSSQNMHAGNC